LEDVVAEKNQSEHKSDKDYEKYPLWFSKQGRSHITQRTAEVRKKSRLFEMQFCSRSIC